MNRVFNFSPGPAMLPTEVIVAAKKELCNWNNLGASVMEISHRSNEFIEVAKSSEQDLRDLLAIPDNYKVLFCQGGARAQFAAVPMNFLKQSSSANYINSGYWANSAIKEAKKYCDPINIDVTTKINGLRAIKPMSDWKISNKGAYIHYCPNETIDGLAIYELPDFDDQIVVADCSSMILSYPINISRFGAIYACAQKNIGLSGLTIVIVRDDLIGYAKKFIPSILDYNVLAKNNSMFNTPPTFAWYIASLVFKWLKSQGGLEEINKRNKAKSLLLYRVIDESDLYFNNIAPVNRSRMNVTFQLSDNKLNSLFLQESRNAGLFSLKGHRAVGGMRASLYNSMLLEGVEALVNFMLNFAYRYG